jgi:hypothetical protein
MKEPFKRFIRYGGILLLMAGTIFSGCRCAPKPGPDPLAGWQGDFGQPNQEMVTDYQNYMHNLPPEERKSARVSDFLKK